MLKKELLRNSGFTPNADETLWSHTDFPLQISYLDPPYKTCTMSADCNISDFVRAALDNQKDHFLGFVDKEMYGKFAGAAKSKKADKYQFCKGEILKYGRDLILIEETLWMKGRRVKLSGEFEDEKINYKTPERTAHIEERDDKDVPTLKPLRKGNKPGRKPGTKTKAGKVVKVKVKFVAGVKRGKGRPRKLV
jgi:hypothetical protein